MRAWWAENGNYVLGGVALGVLIVFGWSWRQGTVASEQEAASILYETVLDATNDGQVDDGADAYVELWMKFPETAYAAQSSLAMARLYMENGRDQDAADALRRVIDSDAAGELALVARHRLGRILLYQDKAAEVVDLLEGFESTAFEARFSEVLGDAYQALGDYEKARVAYLAALNDNPAAPTVDPNVIQLKLNDLPIGDVAEDLPLADGGTMEIPEQVEATEEGGDAAEAEPESGDASPDGGDESEQE